MIGAIAGTLPYLAVWVVAAVVAAIRWNRHPVVSALVVTSSAVHALVMVANVVVPMRMMQEGATVASLVPLHMALGLVGLVGTVCMIVAVFIGRQDPRTSEVVRPL